MKKHSVYSIAQLVDAIGAGSFDPRDPGPIVVEIELENGDKITGSYSQQPPDITDPEMVIRDSEALLPFVLQLLDSHKSFVTETGTGEELCTLIWEYVAK